jgi:type IV pilus assembly PilX-like protein
VMNMHNNQERGVALVLALILMSAMSVLAASLMFLSQSETYASMNYRMMSQARYAGEAAVQKASDFLLDNGAGGQYAIPGPGNAIDPLTNYDRTKSPVVCAAGGVGCTPGQPIILSAVTSPASNYPSAAVRTAFRAAACAGLTGCPQGALAAGYASVNFGAYATLLGMQVFDAYGGTQGVILTWQITGVGSLSGPRPANVEVVAVVEQPKVPSNNYAAFATANTCGAMHFHGNVTIDSYDSSVPGGFAASHEEGGGDVGTNGNLQIEGSVAVQGNLYSPRVGVGTCLEGAVTALSETGSADVTGSIVALPTAVTYPLPEFSVTPPTGTVAISSAATLLAACTNLAAQNSSVVPGVNCFVDAVAKSIRIDGNGTDITLPNVNIGGGYKLIIDGNNAPAQAININSLGGAGDIEINANLASDLGESVVLRVAGVGTGTNPLYPNELDVPFDLSLMTWKQNAAAGRSLDASALQLVYGGHAGIHMKGGNSQSSLAIYAPNANFELQGTQDLYGSILARTITNGGNANIHYDRRLARTFFVAGHPMVGSFTWKRY